MADNDNTEIPVRVKDLSGRTFGDWTVLRFAKTEKAMSFWLCECKCSRTSIVRARDLTSGKSKSCGCTRRIKHGMCGRPEYSIWQNIMSRCFNENYPNYKDYGGRGITVCDKWLTFDGFFEDMGKRPDASLSIDRIDNNGPYQKDNCRWATRSTQQRNKRDRQLVNWNGVSRTISEWSEITGLPFNMLMARLKRGWPVDKALTTPRHQMMGGPRIRKSAP